MSHSDQLKKGSKGRGSHQKGGSDSHQPPDRQKGYKTGAHGYTTSGQGSTYSAPDHGSTWDHTDRYGGDRREADKWGDNHQQKKHSSSAQSWQREKGK